MSSRKIERACCEVLAFRVLSGNHQPDHSRISEFRRRNLDAHKALFVQILRLCQKARMVSLGHVALDGTKRWLPFIGQFKRLTSLSPGGRNSD